MHEHSNHVTCVKKSGNPHKIPYAMGLMYRHPPIDNVPGEFQVDVSEQTRGATRTLETIEQAIQVYLSAFNEKFHGVEGRRQRKRSLSKFQEYLKSQGHSQQIKDLTFADGHGFMDSLVNHYSETRLSPTQIKKYLSALRSFSRFLHDLGLIEENVFLLVRSER